MSRAQYSLVAARFEVRHPVESDRRRFVELFCDPDFMMSSTGTRSEAEADRRFDDTMAPCAEVSFAKQPIVERVSGSVVGFTGVGWIEFEDGR
jgi:hypothetical protein